MKRTVPTRTAWAALLLMMIGTTLAPVPGCGPERRGEPYTSTAEIDTAAPQVAAGQVAFMTHCHQCHPGGAGGLGPAINDKPLPEGLIKTQIRQGLGAMPAFDERHIPDRDVDAIVAYLKALRGDDRGRDR